MRSQPFFLLGAEAAGVALLEAFLGAHPRVAWGGSFDYALAWEASEHAEWPPLVPYWQHLALSPRVRELHAKIDPSLAFPDLVRSLLDQQRPESGDEVFGVRLAAHYDRALKLWPHARFAFVTSSPRESRPRNAAGDPSPALAPREALRLWRKIAADVRSDRRLEVRYEALVREPARELERVCALLGLDFSETLLRAPQPIPDAADPCPVEAAPAPPERRPLGWRLSKRVADLLGR
jgi:hypothetical protein